VSCSTILGTVDVGTLLLEAPLTASRLGTKEESLEFGVEVAAKEGVDDPDSSITTLFGNVESVVVETAISDVEVAITSPAS
jgi:hypothetical protein